jgi:hypothetical protein
LSDGTFTRVGFPDANGDAQEVRQFSDEDAPPDLAGPALGSPAVDWRAALQSAEARGGAGARSIANQFFVRVMLIEEDGHPTYHVRYAADAQSPPSRDTVVDAETGSTAFSFRRYLTDSERRARLWLGPSAALESIRADWVSNRLGSAPPQGVNPDGELSPVSLSFLFRAVDPPNSRVNLSYNTRAGLVAIPGALPASPAEVLTDPSDPMQLLDLAEEAGGREVRAEWNAASLGWSIRLTIDAQHGQPTADVVYVVAGGGTNVRFRIDLRTGAITRSAA